MLLKALLATLVFISATVQASCPAFTEEQSYLIHKAYHVGYQHDMGYTLAAITIQESFVGEYVVRVNNKDGKHGSYGVTHILLSTAMWLEGYDSSWRAKAKLVPKLIGNDEYALETAVRKLQTVRKRTWWATWRSYNGGGKKADQYAGRISKHVKMLRECINFEGDF
jgi:hypothetical protein